MRRIVGLALGALCVLPGISLAEGIEWKGDFRYRHELIQVENADDRHRNRIRARIGLKAEVNDTLSVIAQLAGGSDDPVSTNQSLDGGFSTKGLWLDMAYFDWRPEAVSGLKILAGKMKTPFYKPGKAELFWDGDLRPEGGALIYDHEGDALDLFANLAGYWVEERGSDADTGLFGAQLGAKLKFGESGSFSAGAAYYDYGNIQGKAPVFDETDSFGNTVDSAGLMAYDYDLIDLFAELGWKLGDTPMAVFGNFAANTDSDAEENQGWLIGATVGKCKKPHSWAFRYYYRNLEADAVLGVYTDSDFIGGGADGKGHEVGFDYQLADNWKGQLSYFFNQRGLEGDGEDFQRLQIDLAAKF